MEEGAALGERVGLTVNKVKVCNHLCYSSVQAMLTLSI